MYEKIKQLPWKKMKLVLWGLVLFFMPVTSFNYLPSFMGTTTIRPLSIYPLILLIALILPEIMKNWRDFTKMKSLVPLALFILLAAGLSLWNGLNPPAPINKLGYWGRVIRAFLSMGIGLIFFAAALWMSRKESSIRYGMVWLYAGLAITFAWGIIQLVAIYTPILDRELIIRIQELYSVRGLRGKRVIGFAYEPSWLADQIMTLYLPWLIGSLFSGFRVTKYRWPEWVLTGMALFLLVFTYSRSGILGFAVAFVVLTTIVGQEQIRQGWQWFIKPFKKSSTSDGIGLRALIAAASILMIVVTGYALSQNPYFSKLWKTGFNEGLDEYIIDNSAGPRVAYAISAFEVFDEHPWKGVGLGALGFYLYDHLPDWVMTTEYEIARHLSEGLFPNAKNMYLRLLGETGIVGFWLFMVFLILYLGFSLKLLSQKEPFLRFIGMAGAFLWLAIGLRNLSQDSLTSPAMWIGLGIVQGAYYFSRTKKVNELVSSD
ncbi:MAG: O-antigen ligase family protein [Anaerolineales bacterium]|nr:O-antigen ligase family protein [Anaerolineales bacterium]